MQVGLLVSSPIFAEASKHHNAFRLIAVGLGIWTLATAGCGLAWGFWSLILCRMLVGVGEASFVALASPFIGPLHPYSPTPDAQMISLTISAEWSSHCSKGFQRLLCFSRLDPTFSRPSLSCSGQR